MPRPRRAEESVRHRRRRLRREGSCAQPARPAPSTPRRSGEEERGRTAGFLGTNPADDACPAPQSPGGRRILGPPNPHCPRFFPTELQAGAAGERSASKPPPPPRRPRDMPAPVCPSAASPPSTPSLGRSRVRSPPTLHGPRPFLPQPGVPPCCPRSRPRRRVRIRNFTSAEGKRERKVCAAPAGEPKRRMRRATRLLLAGASCLSAGLPAPCPARPQLSQPEPWPGCRRRLFRPSDDPAARLPQLPPRSQRCPARARGSHTLTLAGAHSHTRTHAPEGAAAAAAATTTRAESGGRRGARGRGAGPPGGAPANNVGEQPPAREQSFHPGKEES